MTARSTIWRPGDLVPITVRLRDLQLWRTTAILVATAAVTFFSALAVVDTTAVAAGAVGYVVISEAATRLARRTNRATRFVMRALLLGDALAVVALSLGVGGPMSAMRYLLILQVVEVSLLASFRTGLKLAAWQSLMVSSLYVIGPAVAPRLSTTHLVATARFDVFTLVLVTWLSAIITAWLAAANERELRRRRYDLEQLARFHGELEAANTAREAAAAFASMATDELDSPRSLVLVTDGNGTIDLLGGHGLARAGDGDGDAPAFSAAGTALLGEVTEQNRTLLVRGFDAARDRDLAAMMPNATNVAALPLATARGRGMIVVEYGQRAGSRVERRVVTMLERYRDALGTRLSNLWLIDSLRVAATIDPLTGVANRARLRESLHAHTQRAARTGDVVSLMMLDVDHFKKVNDTFGHAAGDEVLRQVAHALQHTVRPYDVVARFGGEEFVVILPSTELADAVAVAERVRRLLPEATAPYAVTASFGVTRFNPKIDDLDRFISRTDELLYEAKHLGRNRVVVERSAGQSVAR